MYSEKETISSESLIDSLHYQGTGRDVCSSHLICRLAYSHYLIFTHDLTFYLLVYCRSSYLCSKDNVKWFFISLSNRKNLQDWESHLRATWISRLEDGMCLVTIIILWPLEWTGHSWRFLPRHHDLPSLYSGPWYQVLNPWQSIQDNCAWYKTPGE